MFWLSLAGLWVEHIDWDPGNATGCLGDWSRLHLCHSQTATNDHLRGRQGPDSDMSTHSRSTPDNVRIRHENVCLRLRRNRPELHNEWWRCFQGITKKIMQTIQSVAACMNTARPDSLFELTFLFKGYISMIRFRVVAHFVNTVFSHHTVFYNIPLFPL